MPPRTGELAAVVDLLDALVAAAGEQLGDVAEVDLLALVSAKPAGRSEASGTASARATALATTTGGSSLAVPGERVEAGDPQARRGAAAARGADS